MTKKPSVLRDTRKIKTMSDFNITLFETCELLNRSKKSISRYIRRGLLHPERVKSQQGTLEYRFSKADIETFKTQEALQVEQARQDRPDRPDRPDGTDQTGHQKSSSVGNEEENSQSRQDTPEQTGHERQDRNRTGTGQDSEVITLLKETTGLLKEQLTKKDEQIKDLGGKIDQLIERDRETNILIGQLQSKVLMLEKPKTEETGQKPDEIGQDTARRRGQDKPVKKGFIEKVKDFLKEK